MEKRDYERCCLACSDKFACVLVAMFDSTPRQCQVSVSSDCSICGLSGVLLEQ